MTVENALYPSQLNTAWPLSSDMVSEGDDHIRRIKIVEVTTWPNIAGVVAASHIELNYIVGVTSPLQGQINGKGAITGQAWTGAHVFSGTIAVPTLAQATNTTGAASTAFVQNEWATRLPNYTGPITASTAELNRMVGVTSGVQAQINAKATKAGDTYTGTHDFSGAASVRVPTIPAGTSGDRAASLDYVIATSLSASLPGQTGNAGKFITTDGANASWSALPVVRGKTIEDGTDANNVTDTGFYRINGISGMLNFPPWVPSNMVQGGQLIVSGNSATCLQIIAGNAFNDDRTFYAWRTGLGIGTGTPAWGAWRTAGNMPVRFVTTAGGQMYDELQGGLNCLNIWQFSTGLGKYMPANPRRGDKVAILVANERIDMQIYPDITVGSMRPIMGLNEPMTLDISGACVELTYTDDVFGWRIT